MLTTSLLLAAHLVAGKPSAAYRIDAVPEIPPGAPTVYLRVLADARPETEVTGAGAGFGNRATKDAIFSDSVAEAVTRALADELRLRRVDARLLAPGEVPPAEAPVLSGEVVSYTARLYAPRTANIPYLSWVTWLWTHDVLAAGAEVALTLHRPGAPAWTGSFRTSPDTQAWVGPLHLSERMRALTRKDLVDLLHAAARDALGRAADAVATELGAPGAVQPLLYDRPRGGSQEVGAPGRTEDARREEKD